MKCIWKMDTVYNVYKLSYSWILLRWIMYHEHSLFDEYCIYLKYVMVLEIQVNYFLQLLALQFFYQYLQIKFKFSIQYYWSPAGHWQLSTYHTPWITQNEISCESYKATALQTLPVGKLMLPYSRCWCLCAAQTSRSRQLTYRTTLNLSPSLRSAHLLCTRKRNGSSYR